MKGHNRSEMNDLTDIYIRREIKNWAAQHQPPANGRARLLLVAASPDSHRAGSANRRKKLFEYFFERSHQPPSRAIDLYNVNWLWAMHMSFAHLRHVA